MVGKRLFNYLKSGIVLLVLSHGLMAAEHRGEVKFGGMPLPGATITVTNGDKRLTAVTDQMGAYSFANLADGIWKIRVEMLCFEPIEKEVAVGPSAPAPAWELKLLPFEAIKASAPPPPPPSTPAATTSATPAPGATPAKTETVAVAPAAKLPKGLKLPKGVPPPQAANTNSGFQRAQANASGDGARPPENSSNGSNAAAAQSAPVETAPASAAPSDGFLVNGSVNNGASTPFAQSAAFGNNRRGPRSLYNSSLGLTFGNAFWDARSYSITGQDTPKPGYSHVQGMASFGGPIRIPRLVTRNGPNLVLNYQWTRNRNANTQPGRMPTAAERIGDFSQSLNALGKPVTVIDPTTGTPFAGNIVPQNRISPQALSLLSYYPLPNFTGSNQYNYQVPLVGSTHSDTLQGRINKAIGRKNNINANGAMMSSRSDSTNLFGFVDNTRMLGYQLSGTWMHRFSMRVFGTLTYQFSRQTASTNPFFANRQNVAGAAGITGANQDPINWGPPSLSFSSGISTLSDALSSRTRNQTHALTPSLFWSHAAHNFTIGGEYRRQQANPVSQQDPRGTFNFTGAATGSGGAAGSDFAGFLLGIPDTSSIAYGNADKYFRWSTYAAYFMDDWRVSPSLTLNLGMRWEYGSPITEKYGRLVNLDIAPGFAAIAPVKASNPTGSLTGRHYADSLLQPDKKGFEPRVALSWRPMLASSMVIRAGYGVYRDTSVYIPIASRMAQQSPLSTSLSLNNADHPLTLANAFYLAPNVATNTFAVDPDFRMGYSQNWYVSLQRDLPGSLVMTARYDGIKGTRAQQQFLPNTYPTDATPLCGGCPNGYQFLTSNGNSTRESGNLQLRRRLHSGFTAQLSYTWSKSIDDAALGGRGPVGANGQSAPPSASVIAQDWLNLSGERGLSPFDQRHLLNVQIQYTTGMGLKGGTLLDGWRGRLIKDWTFLSNITAGSGLPLTPIYGLATNGTSVTGSIRPNYTGADLYSAPSGLFLNPAAVTAPAAGQWGNAGRNSITGPSTFTINASMARTFRFSDRVSADFRMDATNPLNHVTYPSWNVVASSSQFGLPSTANQMRKLQATMRVSF
jgi:trimeric autotransporter adhesin